ncbi:MAG TPA: hypothetical protein VF177_01985 [Anaerolineae bacterium]
MSESTYPVPTSMKAAGGRSRFAFVTFLMLNDSYLPGALMLAYALRRQQSQADLVCLVTEEITAGARYALELLFDHVVRVEKIFVPHRRRQQRQDRPYWFTRMNALRLGEDGDLGLHYEKIVLLDADVLPLRYYDHLFLLNAPAGIINEQKSHFLESSTAGQYVIPPSVETTGTWKWHQLYGPVCPHGRRIPREITDRVQEDVTNLGINTSLLVLQPSLDELKFLKEELGRPAVRRLVGDLFDWPDMQYLTLRWSGRWTNVDLRFSGLNGYPSLKVLFGTHYAGFKPWYFGRAQSMAHYGRFDDFRFWFKEYGALMAAYPGLQKVKRLRVLQQNIQRLQKRFLFSRSYA